MAYIGVSPSNGVRQKHTYTATASQTTFSGAGSEGVSLSYRDSNYVDVYRNGVKLGDADYTATSGTSIVLGEGAAVSDIIEIVTYDVFSVADTVSKADGGTFDGNVAMAGTLAVTGETTLSANLNLGDNDKAIFGAGDDLQIYHDGSNSYVSDNGTGNFFITTNGSGIYLRGSSNESLANFVQNDAVSLYFDNSPKFNTSSTGINVTGVITTDGMTTSADINFGDNDKAVFGAGSDLQIYHDESNSIIKDAGTGRLQLLSNRLDINKSDGTEGMATFIEDAQVILYYDNSVKFQTTSTGIEVTDTVNNTPTINIKSSDTVVVANDVVGAITFEESDATGGTGVQAFVKAIANDSGNTYDMSIGVGGNTEAIRIDQSGNVGIGTSSPSSYSSTTLEVKGSSTTSAIKMTNSTTGGGDAVGFDFEMNSNNMNFVNRTSDGDQKFWTNSTERMSITSGGNLLVGGTSPSQTTKVGLFGGSNTSRILNLEVTHTTNFGAVGFVNGNGTVGSISIYSNSVAYNTSSDYRLKENVTVDWDATTRLKQLNPVRFNFIADADTTVDGFLAHEVQSVVPEAISGTHNEVDADGNPVYQGIDQSKLVPLLVKTIQELEARITALENA